MHVVWKVGKQALHDNLRIKKLTLMVFFHFIADLSP